LAGRLIPQGRLDVVEILVAFGTDGVRADLQSLIAKKTDWKLCGAARIAEAYELALDTQPDIVVIDIVMPEAGISLARLLRDDLPDARCIILTTRSDAEMIRSALAAGVKGYVLKQDGDAELAAAIAHTAGRQSYFSPAVLDAIVGLAGGEPSSEVLTWEEVAVLRSIANGDTSDRAAEMLGLSVKALAATRASAMHKAGARNVSELIRFAKRKGIIT
jgi:DNA-binding NarL/FixJ family response regulator